MRKIQSKDAKAGFSAVVDQVTAAKPSVLILSRNERRFAPLDVIVADPFRKLPADK